MSDTVTISQEEYDRLKKDQCELECLKAAGVDNWEGCEYAYRRFRKYYRDPDADEEDDDED